MDENQPDIDGLDTQGALALQKSVPNERDFVRKGGGRRALRVVGEPHPEGDDRLWDPDGRNFVETDNTIAPLFEALATGIDTVEGRVRLDRVYKRVAGPRHLRTILPTLIKTIETRRREGVSWLDVTDNLQINVPVDGTDAYFILADENGFTDASTNVIEGQEGENIATATGVVHTYDKIVGAAKVGLYEPIVGDAALVFARGKRKKDESLKQMAANPAKMMVRHLASKRDEQGIEKYPLNEAGERTFTRSIGVLPIGNSKVNVLAYSGKGKQRKGGVMVIGAARDEVTELQKKAGAGEIKYPDNYVEAEESTDLANGDDELPIPESPWVALKAIEAIFQMTSFSNTAVASLLEETDAEESSETLVTPRLDAYYMVLSIEGGNVERFWELLTDEGTGTDKIMLFKPVGGRELHFWTDGIKTPHDFEQEVAIFTRQMARITKTAGVSFKMSRSHEKALQLIPLPGGIQVDATGPSIVDGVRGITCLDGEEGNCVWVTESACASLGLVGKRAEFTTRIIKGKPFRGVVLKIDAEGNTSIREALFGREEALGKAQAFIRNLGQNGVALRVHKPEGAQERGYGESAILRAAETHARAEGFSDNQIVYLARGKKLFAELQEKTGHTVEELIETPQLLNDPVLLFLDTDSMAPEDAAQLDRFLTAMVGAKIGLIYTGAYHFRPGAILGDQYKGRELADDAEVGELSPEEAKNLVFQTRIDLTEADDERIAQLLKYEWMGRWNKPLVPRLLIHNFARAIYKRGDMLNLDEKIANQVWVGELSEMMDSAKLSEPQRLVLGVVAEIGFPVPAHRLSAMLHFSTDRILEALTQTDPAFLVAEGEGAERVYSPASDKIRNARLLVGKDKKAYHDFLVKNDFFREKEPLVDEKSLQRCNVELDHCLAYPTTCVNDRAVELVRLLGRYHASESRDFGAAYNVYHDFLAALEKHGLLKLGLILPAPLVLDLVWALTQTTYSKNLELAKLLTQSLQLPCTPDHHLQLLWRREGRMASVAPVDKLPALQEGHPFHALLLSINGLAAYFNTKNPTDHQHLDRCLRLEQQFELSAQEALVTESEIAPFTHFAFKGASLARRANAARIFERCAEVLRVDPSMEAGGLAYETLGRAAEDLKMRVLRDLVGLEATVTGMEPKNDFDQELLGEIYRFLADARKYLFPRPTQDEFTGTAGYFNRAKVSLANLDRPLPFARFDCVDVELNHAVMYVDRAIKESPVLNRETTWSDLESFEAIAERESHEAVKLAMLPYRYRFLIQRMNFTELKYRLLLRESREGDDTLRTGLEKKYRELNDQASRLYELINGKPQPNYFDIVFAPLMAKA